MLDLAERVSRLARDQGVELALIGAAALAAHGYVRGTLDVDLAANVDPYTTLRELQRALESDSLHTKLNLPDADDVLGGVLRVWTEVDEDGDPLDPLDIVNFRNPLRAGVNPGASAVGNALEIDPGISPLRYVRLSDLVALKLYAGSRRDLADVVELLRINQDADLSEVRQVAGQHGYADRVEVLIAEALAG